MSSTYWKDHSEYPLIIHPYKERTKTPHTATTMSLKWHFMAMARGRIIDLSSQMALSCSNFKDPGRYLMHTGQELFLAAIRL